MGEEGKSKCFLKGGRVGAAARRWEVCRVTERERERTSGWVL